MTTGKPASGASRREDPKIVTEHIPPVAPDYDRLLSLCGSCDAGLLMSCSCPETREVQRALLHALGERDRLLCDIHEVLRREEFNDPQTSRFAARLWRMVADLTGYRGPLDFADEEPVDV